jgi:hypothetical protein
VSRLPRVYLAGKIGKHDWRHGLFQVEQWGGRRYDGTSGPILRYNREHDLVEAIAPGSTRDGFEYAGPYFLSDDHGCFHGQSQHGLIDPGWADGPGIDGDWPSPLGRRTVMRSCLRWLASADVVFCWLETTDAYGTLVELGYAKGRSIPVYLAPDMNVQAEWMSKQDDYHEPPLHATEDALAEWETKRARSDQFFTWEAWADLWFARALADGMDGDWTPQGAWQDFVKWWAKRNWNDRPQRRLWFVEWER